MNPADLDSLRRKVESGERLSDAELDLLRNAARDQPGPTLRLAVAHALINAEDARGALTLLERLVLDFPRELQGWLGLARALFALDRTAEGERALRRALEISPGDPEALKVLAMLALRRGEFARARELVGDVLRRDPFDDEARLIRAELEAADVAVAMPTPETEPQPVALRPEFTRTLLRMLRARGVLALVRENTLFIRPEGAEAARVDLASLYAGYLQRGGPVEPAVRAIVDGLVSASGLPLEASRILEAVRPVLRAPQLLERAAGAAHREGPAGLRVFYVLEDPSLVRYLPAGALTARGISLEEVDRAAFDALASRPAPLRRVTVQDGRLLLDHQEAAGGGVWALCAGDGHDGARLLLTSERARISEVLGPGPWRVDLRRRECVLLCRADDRPAIAVMEGLSGEPGEPAYALHLLADGTWGSGQAISNVR